MINLTRYNGPKKHYQVYNMKPHSTPGSGSGLGSVMSLSDDIGALTRMLTRIHTNQHTNTTDTSSTDIMDATELEVLEHQFDDYIQQLPNTISISFAGLKSNELISIIQTELACSSGSACHSLTAGVSMSSVLQAMNISNSYGFGTLRISFGRYTTLEDVHQMVCIIINGINTLREMKMKMKE